MIAHARHDERGKYSGGAAGDQDTSEVAITQWYDRPWNCVLRAPSAKARWKIAEIAEAIARNDRIGYDQGERTSLYNEAKKVNFDIYKIKTNCECDCSSMVAVCAIAAGFNVSPDIYTGNERAALTKVGFTAIKSADYLKSESYLLRGDVLLYEGHHTAVNLDDGNKAIVYSKGWNKETRAGQKSRWWYADTYTTYLHDTWKLINHYYYYFDSDGYAVTGLQKIDGNFYYFTEYDANKQNSLECTLCHTDASGVLTPWYID